MEKIPKLIRNLKKAGSAFVGHWKRVVRISGQKIRVVCYRLYIISYEIVYEIVEKPEVFLVRVVLIAVFRFVLVFTRFLLVKTFELTRACLHFLYSTGSVYIYRRFADDRLVVIYRNPFLEILIAILVTRMIYEDIGKLARIFASREIDFDYLDLLILVLFILIVVYM